MKRTAYLAMIMIFSTLLYSCDKEKLITQSELPSASREFISTHFSGVNISMIVKEREIFSCSYTVYLGNGFEIDFTKSGDWDDIDGKHTAIPESILTLLPKNILVYTANTIPDCYIVEINREHYGYEIGLSNDIDLKFNTKGEFLRMDD
ncbi:MAG: PepSY-like domain-containing protein [Bacteroidales bacterium]|jgi:hypothetical protein|nr:PepSY-like domain-containing protein [Bacteroidales bacterium]